MTQIEFIDYRLIFEDPTNPRKNFNKEAIEELAENIKQQGLLQPITVRPYPTMRIELPKILSEKPCFQIVCGARRYKACIKAGVKEIPSIVREMTDEEAFDAMITENLQRKDVEPMEEARAFVQLHSRGTTFEELAARFGKSVSYIRLRIKLADLIPEFIELLDKNLLQLTHAQEFCKLSPETQNEFFIERYSDKAENWNNWIDKPIKDIRQYLQSDFRDLDKAVFDKTECISCKFRCGANVLFEEYDSNKCTKPTCFEEKKFKHRLETAIQYANDGYVLLKSDYQYRNDEVINELEKLGYKLIENNYKILRWHNPAELPERGEDDTDEEWAQEQEDYKLVLAEENEKLQSGEYKKGWFVGYWSEDEYKLIEFKDANTTTPEAVIQNENLNALNEKAKRNEELKNEKTIEDLKKLMSNSEYQELKTPISDSEKVAMIALMLKHTHYTIKQNIEEQFKPDMSPFDNVKNVIGTPLETKIIREFIKHNITDNGVNYEKGTQSVLKTICSEAFPEEAARIELKHQETYLKRKESIEQKLKELSEK